MNNNKMYKLFKINLIILPSVQQDEKKRKVYDTLARNRYN